jgi:hypothetical protein
MRRSCAIPGCGRAATERGWCHGHYLRWARRRALDPDRPLDRRVNSVCSVDGCGCPATHKQLCSTHAARLRKFGDVRADKPVRIVTGVGFISHGYLRVPIPPDLRHLTRGITQSSSIDS